MIISFGTLCFMHLVLGRNLNIFLANFFQQVRSRVIRVGSGHRSTCFYFRSKTSGLGKVFFESSQKILTRIGMSNDADA